MSDLFWPGVERAGNLMTSAALVQAMVEVERMWLECLADSGIAPTSVSNCLPGIGIEDAEELAKAVAAGAESGGNPVIPLVRLLRNQLADPAPSAAKWLHRGLTSQDVLDTALMLCLRDVLEQVREDVDAQIAALSALAEAHRRTLMAGRTLTQYAVPTTFGLKAAQWLTALLDARDSFDLLPAPAVQIGGAAGTLSAVLELARSVPVQHRHHEHPRATVRSIVENISQRLDLTPGPAWHTARRPITAIGDALVSACDAWGRIARDVIELGRPEIGELGEPVAEGRGGSSTMAQKQNPVLCVLIRRSALSAPQLGATLHLAAAEAVDERPDGSWQAEWPALHSLARATVTASGQATELLSGLRVFPDRMRANLAAAEPGILAEQASMRSLFPDAAGPGAPEGYLGMVDPLLTEILFRAHNPRRMR